MSQIQKLKDDISLGILDGALSRLYSPNQLEHQKNRIGQAIDSFGTLFGQERSLQLFSAPGRTEVGGNHTDHQHGRVLAAAVNLDTLCIVSPCEENRIRVKSKGHRQDDIDLSDLKMRPEEENTARALIRGVCSRFVELGYRVGGFDAYTVSDVLKGSGLSSSAAFEVAIGTILNHLYNNGSISAVEIAQIGQYAESRYFGKPSGLMDQTASSVGSFVTIDFKSPSAPVVEPVAFDFASSGYSLCIVDTKGSHADLTNEYAYIPQEMKQVAQVFGKEVLRDVNPQEFSEQLARVRKSCGDRAALRALHFFAENDRVPQQVAALRSGDFERFKELIIASGRSSYMYLQNVFAVSQVKEQGVSLALALSEQVLAGRGAWRVHGGGFAGTIQAFVPNDLLETYRHALDAVFGEGSCQVLNIRPAGGVKITPDLLSR